jgi:hypothetical protein
LVAEVAWEYGVEIKAEGSAFLLPALECLDDVVFLRFGIEPEDVAIAFP